MRWYKYTFNDIILMGCEKIINKYLHLTFVDAEWIWKSRLLLAIYTHTSSCQAQREGGGCRRGRKLTGRAKFRGLVGPDFYQIPNFFVQFLHWNFVHKYYYRAPSSSPRPCSLHSRYDLKKGSTNWESA